YPARAAHTRAVVGVVAGDACLVADQFGGFDPPPQTGTAFQRVEQELHACLCLALLEVVGPAHRADAHHAVGQGNHPHPAVFEAVYADISRILAAAPLGAAKMAENGRALMLLALAPQLL